MGISLHISIFMETYQLGSNASCIHVFLFLLYTEQKHGSLRSNLTLGLSLPPCFTKYLSRYLWARLSVQMWLLVRLGTISGKLVRKTRQIWRLCTRNWGGKVLGWPNFWCTCMESSNSSWLCWTWEHCTSPVNVGAIKDAGSTEGHMIPTRGILEEECEYGYRRQLTDYFICR